MILSDELANPTSILPPINNGSLGKTSGALIKQLLDNLTGEGNAKVKSSSLAY